VLPTGSRWSAKSCQHPLRVRQMMLRAIRALRAVGDSHDQQEQASPPRRGHQLLLASACEFLADTFLAEDAHKDDAMDALRYVTALRHLRSSSRHLAEYVGSGTAPGHDSGEAFSQSVSRLEDRLLAKRTNGHLSLARIRQRQRWSDHGPSNLRFLGQAMQELDAAEALVSQPSRVALPQRPLGSYERSLLASISKWKADILHELAALCTPPTPGADLDPQIQEYLSAQQQETGESTQPLAVQQERWLQSAISLSLRSLHQLTTLPSEVTDELQLQARGLLARAYGDLGHIYASTGRYTKAMTHAKQGIELFNATKDRFHAAFLQMWLCRLQLRMALPQAAAPGRPAATATAIPSQTAGEGGGGGISSNTGGKNGAGLDDNALLRGIPAVKVGGAEDTTCSQVVIALQRVLKGLENSDAELAMLREGQALLGRIFLRQGLARLACVGAFRLVCRLCEEDTDVALAAALELVQVAEHPGIEGVREAVDLLLQASASFREAHDAQPAGMAHACLAAAYFCSNHDSRVQRVVLTHCQHAQEHLGDAGGAGRVASLRLAVELLEAKALRRVTGGKGRSSDAKAAALLCDIAIGCHRSPPPSPRPGPEAAADTRDDAAEEDCSGSTACPPPPRALAVDDKKSLLISYVKQELGDVLVRMLRGNAGRQAGSGRELKARYCALLTAWHAETGQVEALVALREHLREGASVDPTGVAEPPTTDATVVISGE